MSYFENKCPNCGATFVRGDTYCRTCSTPLEYEPTPEEAKIEGINVSDWHLFLDKNATRYVDIFSKNEGKKIFFKMNWAAMFFSFYWMFYRKMYKYAIIFLITSIVFSLGLTVIVTTTYKPSIREAEKIIEPYSQYLVESNNIYGALSDGTVDTNELLKAAKDYKEATNSIIIKIGFWILVPSILFQVLFGLLADCIYRRYVIRNINKKSGGTHGWSIVGAIIIYTLVNEIIVSPITTYMVEKFFK